MVSKVTIGSLIVLFIGVVVTLTLITEIGNPVNEMRNKFTVSNESHSFVTCRNGGAMFTINNTGCNFTIDSSSTRLEGWRKNSCPIGAVTLQNCTGDDLTATTDYIYVGGTGTFELKNTSATRCANNTGLPYENYTFVYYDYCGDYATDGSTRSVANLIIIFAALGLIGFVVFYSVKQFF